MNIKTSLRLISFVGFLIFTLVAKGQYVPPGVKVRAENYVKEVFPETPDISVNELKIGKLWKVDGEVAMVLLYRETTGGYLIVTAEPFADRLIAYSSNAAIGGEELPPAMEWWLEKQVLPSLGFKHVFENIEQGDKEYHGKRSFNTLSSGVTPLLSSTWDQRCFYNDSCPPDTNAPAFFCAKAPAGCVATTLAQIMKYYKWPLQGVGSKSYYSVKYGTIQADFSSTFYNMASMPDEIFNAHPGVAQLLWHAGVASQMNYGPLASGTGIADARNALVNHFDYLSSAQVVVRSNYTDSAWRSLMRNEIDLGRPVFYSGIDPTVSSGHAFVMDGYSGLDFFHFNWGWSGIADGYFLLTSLNPMGGSGYNTFQDAIIGIAPAGNLPRSAFTADQTSIDAGDVVQFTNLSTGNTISSTWLFEGGVPAIYQGFNPPLVQYDKSGYYQVVLCTSDGTHVDTLIKTAYIQVLPLAGFQASQKSMPVNTEVTFLNTSQSHQPIIHYNWRFFGGQPSTSSQKNPPPVLYAQSGQYPVLLEISDGTHSDRRLEVQYITVYPQCDTLLDFYMPGWSVQAINQDSFQVYTEDLDGLTPYHQTSISSGWDYFSESGGVNHFISATSLFLTPGVANNWLIFGPITIPSSGATLEWQHKFPDHTKRDGYAVMISDVGHSHTHFTDPPVFALADNDPFTLEDSVVWSDCSVGIDSIQYGSKEVWFGIHHYADNMFYIGLDDFRIVHCNPFPLESDFFAFDTIISAGDSIQFYNFSSGEPLQTQWDFPGGVQTGGDQNNPVVRYDIPGTYDVELVSIYGGGSSTAFKPGYIKVLPISVENFLAGASVLTPFPNPFQHSIRINGLDDPCYYQITDIQGKVMAQGWVGTQERIDLFWLPSGVWFLQLMAGDTFSNYKLIKY